ncbi:putative bifunctional diguanylate cyclase/phosphodiesterase [Tepidibacillus fermentans]|uniref:EAL domain-containing protein (Putative c-di-GMP-specific phosphodiesterase class I) n=1 Tax=Tepidibacillus fermentans TaxID=1281767 RepID=A0A4R3KNF8_9BACI|nr:EAL domain-containing protein [Tepidibacillus fermentans]TCS84558.1 EAL domain-containing protein (putative c-di-GMP-specific phosphodiesterase class I) [Tepidibacillus fermentans]
MEHYSEDAVRRQHIIMADLLHAIERDEFVVYYQPLMNVTTKQITGVEALIRWQHPTLGMIPPVEFIPLAEKTGVINELGKWVLRKASEQIKSIHYEGFSDIRIMVNISPLQLQEPNFVEMVKQILEETQLDPHYLDLEITENIETQPNQNILKKIRELQSMGIQISMDDFGTGYSSLSKLRDLPFDTVKIDGLFLQNVPINKKNATIVETLVALGEKLNLRVVAEGVETKEQLNFLIDKRCQEIQGYLLSKPIPFNKLKSFLKSKIVFDLI